MNVLRITRHAASTSQLAELRRIFGDDCVITEINETLPADAREAVVRFDALAADADVVEAVLPLPLTQAVLTHSQFAKRGGALVKALMKSDRAGGFELVGYERIIEIRIITERL